MRLLVIHPHPLVQDAMRLVVRGVAPDAEIVFAEDVERAPAGALDHAIVDVSLGRSAPLSTLAAFRARFPGVPYVVASATPLDPGTMFGAAQLGAVAQITMAQDLGSIRETLSRLMRSGARPVEARPAVPATPSAQPAIAPQAAVRVEPAPAARPATTPVRPGQPNLTARQMEVLQLLLCGLSNKRISRHLDLSPSTVKIHVSAVLRALNVRSRTEAVVAATERGIAPTRPVALEPRVRTESVATRSARGLAFAPY